MKSWIVLLLVLTGWKLQAQATDSIYFHLYTDSLKKGVHNYINVDALRSDKSYFPLSDKEVIFTSNTGTWIGCNLVIDSSYNKDSVEVTAVLRENPLLRRTVIIYMKKNLVEEQLKTTQELLDSWNSKKKKGNR
jgi:hypothetical protein